MHGMLRTARRSLARLEWAFASLTVACERSNVDVGKKRRETNISQLG